MEVSRERLKLVEGKNPLSPPIVVAPLYRCATAVVVTDFIAGADLDIEVNGAIVVAGFPLSCRASTAAASRLTASATARVAHAWAVADRVGCLAMVQYY